MNFKLQTNTMDFSNYLKWGGVILDTLLAFRIQFLISI